MNTPAIRTAIDRLRETHPRDPTLFLHHRVLLGFGNRSRMAQRQGDRCGAHLYRALERCARAAWRAAGADPELVLEARLVAYGRPHANPRTLYE